MPIPEPIFDMPMDETYNSPIAYDFSPNQSHAKVQGCHFAAGQQGNAMYNNGFGTAKTRNTPLILTNDFTVCLWAKNSTLQGYATPTGVKFQFEINGASVLEFDHAQANLETWVFWAIVKNASGAKIYKNGAEIGSVSFGATDLTAWAVKQIVPSSGSGFDYTLDLTFGASSTPFASAGLDEVLIFDSALTPSQINEVLQPIDSQILYWIDDNKFVDFGVYVSDSSGLVGALQTKEFVTVNWAGEHGIIADLERPRFMPREITLECFFEANGFMDFTLRMTEFLNYFKSKGTHRLKVEIDHRKPLVYEVYMTENTEIKKKWKAEKFIGTFNLKLIEYLPIKRVLRFSKTNLQTTVQINIDCETPFNFYWGDGTVTENIIGQQTISHTYVENKIYQIICAGVLDDLNAFTHNGILLWSNL